MKKLLSLVLFLVFFSTFLYSQNTGKEQVNAQVNGIMNSMIITNPAPCDKKGSDVNNVFYPTVYPQNSSMVRYSAIDPIGIGNDISTSGNGLNTAVGWALNNKRVELFGNTNNTPLWIYPTSTAGNRSYVAVSDTGGMVAVGAYKNIYLFDKSTNTPYLNFDLTTTADTGAAGPLDVTSSGNFLVASGSRNDSSKIYGFAKGSNTPTWKVYIPGGQIYGIRICGNDSLVIVNTYSYVKVINTYTGVVRYGAAITNGTQCAQGISGNGNIIVTVNFYGYVKVYQWNGSTYNMLWQYQEPTGTYYNWISCVDVSYDGAYVAAGTLNFVTSSSYDGKVRFFKVSNGNVPLWSTNGAMDEISGICFSKNGKILAACSWGPTDYSKDNIFIYRANPGNGTVWFSAKAQGSADACSISDDGTTVTVSGKLVHERMMGSGGTYYNIFVDTNFNPTGIHLASGTVPAEFKMYQNYPNPFNPSTRIKFDLPQASDVKLAVYNSAGMQVRELVNERLSAGSYDTEFDGGKLSSGIYFAVIKTDKYYNVLKMILIK
ncbi:MAG: T9SS type A sorting domain-containing protein [Ignavibacteria bacterium]|nr:T9SS type A sorting domain-containing protein [Ignavibacteria bacterium]